MPYPNEHAARLVDPEKFDPDSFRRVNDKFGDGIHAIFGKLKGENSMTLQAVRFDADKFTAEEAKKWLKGHDYDPIEFEEAGSQKAPSYFVPLAKADEAKHEVWGTAAIEQPDASGEIMFQYPLTDRGGCNYMYFVWRRNSPYKFQYPLTDRGGCNENGEVQKMWKNCVSVSTNGSRRVQRGRARVYGDRARVSVSTNGSRRVQLSQGNGI